MKHLKFLTLALISVLIGVTSCDKKDDPNPEEVDYDVLVDGLAYYLDLDNLTASLTNKTIPSTYTGNVTVPSTINVSGREFTVTAIDGLAFWQSPVSSVSLPNTLLYINQSAFYQCSSLKSINFPSSLISISKYGFRECGFTSITIPSNVMSLGEDAFFECVNLKSVNIEDSENSLRSPNAAFSGCNVEDLYLGRNVEGWLGLMADADYVTLKTLTIGKEVTNIGTEIYKPLTITSFATTPPTLRGISDKARMESTVYVPAESLELYKENEMWGKFWNIEAIK